MGSSKQEKNIKNTKKRNREPVNNDESARDADNYDTHPIAKLSEEDVAKADMKPSKSKKARKSRSKDNSSTVPIVAVIDADNSFEEEKKRSKKVLENKDEHSTKKKTKSAKKKMEVALSDVHKSKKSLKNKNRNNPSSCVPSVTVSDAGGSCKKKRKSKKIREEKDIHSANKKTKSEPQLQEITISEVYQISSVEGDETKGMKKWIKEFHERRPGLKVLQDRIDNFITAHEEQEEQQRREREAKLSEEGWTVVVHRKGGKRTTDPDSGVAVGSVAEAAVREKIAKKKNKDIGVDFYRFQRKEAHRSEVMKLQSKFEEDKKRIQQIRAARKFKPY